MPELTTLGGEFASALAKKDSSRLLELLAPEIDFQAMTPRRTWQASDPEAVLSIVFGHWFEDADHIEALEALDTDSVADRQRVGYRFSVSNPEGRFLVEQQAYLSERDGQIVWMRVLCSGYQPVELQQ
jgi:DNA-binding IclR family transcriptional regulator